MNSQTIVTVDDLITGFDKLNIKQGDYLIVHSSLSSFGYIEDGAVTLIDALKAMVGKDGLIMMPTFTYGSDVFNPSTSKSQTGFVTEYFRQLPDTIRSGHPTHSVCCWGLKANEVVSDHFGFSAFDNKSPFAKIYKTAKVLMLGTDYNTCSVIHFAQELAQVKFLHRPKIVKLIDGQAIVSMQVNRAGCSLGFHKISPLLESKSTSMQIGNAVVTAISAYDIVEHAMLMLLKNQSSLFCDNDSCFSCQEASLMI